MIERVGTVLCWCIPFGSALACTSFGNLFDAPPFPDVSEDAGVASGQPPPAPGSMPELPGVPGVPGVSVPVGQTPGAPPLPLPPSGSFDAGGPSTPLADAGRPVPDPPGEVCLGSALSLDGTNFAVIPRVVQDDFTIEAWIATTLSRMGTNAFYGRAVFDADIAGMGANDDFAASVLNDRFAFAVGNPDTSIEGITPVITGEWTHVALTRRRSTGEISVFVNGALDGSTVTENRAALTATMTIALGGASLERNFVGLIDEVKIWNVVREGSTIAASMRVRPAASEPGLVGYYSFEDRGAAETADGSALGLAAALMGSPGYEASSALCAPEAN